MALFELDHPGEDAVNRAGAEAHEAVDDEEAALLRDLGAGRRHRASQQRQCERQPRDDAFTPYRHGRSLPGTRLTSELERHDALPTSPAAASGENAAQPVGDVAAATST